jgi:hypothetical protein
MPGRLGRQTAGHLLGLLEQWAVLPGVPRDAAAAANVVTLHRVCQLLASSHLTSGGMLHSLCSLHRQLHMTQIKGHCNNQAHMLMGWPSDGRLKQLSMHVLDVRWCLCSSRPKWQQLESYYHTCPAAQRSVSPWSICGVRTGGNGTAFLWRDSRASSAGASSCRIVSACARSCRSLACWAHAAWTKGLRVEHQQAQGALTADDLPMAAPA